MTIITFRTLYETYTGELDYVSPTDESRCDVIWQRTEMPDSVWESLSASHVMDDCGWAPIYCDWDTDKEEVVRVYFQ